LWLEVVIGAGFERMFELNTEDGMCIGVGGAGALVDADAGAYFDAYCEDELRVWVRGCEVFGMLLLDALEVDWVTGMFWMAAEVLVY
jgi:hypothetical protein